MSTLNERLLTVMDELDIPSQRALAAFCGVTEGLVAQWFSGDTKLGPKPLKAFAAKSYFSLNWISDGVLPKYRNRPESQRNTYVEERCPEEDRLVMAYRAANFSQRAIGLTWADTILAGTDLDQRSGTND